MASREEIRQASIGTKRDFKREIVECDGVTYEVRQPSVRGKTEIFQKARVPDARTEEEMLNKIDPVTIQIYAVINCTYVPGTDERVFTDEDFELLEGQPSGSFVDVIGEVAMGLINKKPADDAKNSEDAQAGED